MAHRRPLKPLANSRLDFALRAALLIGVSLPVLSFGMLLSIACVLDLEGFPRMGMLFTGVVLTETVLARRGSGNIRSNIPRPQPADQIERSGGSCAQLVLRLDCGHGYLAVRQWREFQHGQR